MFMLRWFINRKRKAAATLEQRKINLGDQIFKKLSEKANAVNVINIYKDINHISFAVSKDTKSNNWYVIRIGLPSELFFNYRTYDSDGNIVVGWPVFEIKIGFEDRKLIIYLSEPAYGNLTNRHYDESYVEDMIDYIFGKLDHYLD